MSSNHESRRKFLRLGLAASGAGIASLGMGGFRPPTEENGKSGDEESTSTNGQLPRGIDLEKWNRIKGKPYELGDFGTVPGVCQLPGPQAKRNWPDRNKYKDVNKVPGMCQL